MLRVEEPVSDKGFITRRFVQETRQQMEGAEQELRRARSDLLRLDAEELDLLGRRDQEIYHQQEKVNGARRSVEWIIRTPIHASSPIAGHVTEVRRVSAQSRERRARAQHRNGRRGTEPFISRTREKGGTGMQVRAEPATAKKEESERCWPCFEIS
jgi:hypothetical protein